jgi:V8-like Glu-specific endopeptidase
LAKKSIIVISLLYSGEAAYSFDLSGIKKFFIPEFESLQDVKEASKFIKSSSRAVFRFEGGTGSFVKYNDQLYIMTNNHVLGYKHCARNGCFAKAIFNYEKGKSAVNKTLFVTPVAASTDVDVSFFKFKEVTANGDFLSVKPNVFLNLTPSNAQVGSEVYPIGHPRKSIKKYSSGKIVKYENGYMFVDALTLPGNSGSPIVNSAGEIVGIHHSSAKKNDGFTRDGLLYVGRASSNISIVNVLEKGLKNTKDQLVKFWDVNKPVSYRYAKKFSKIYIKSKTIPSLRSKQDFFDSLYEDCKTKLDLGSNHAGKFVKSHEACSVASSWINCGKGIKEDISVKYVLAATLNDSHPDFEQTSGYCPNIAMKKKWANLFLKIGHKYRSFHGKDPLLWTAEALSKLISNSKTNSKVVLKNIEAELGKDSANVTVTNMLRVASNSEALSSLKVKNIDIKSQIKDYKKIVGYEYELSKIAKTANELHNNMHFTDSEFKTAIDSILSEDQLSLNAKLIVEKIAYEKGLL